MNGTTGAGDRMFGGPNFKGIFSSCYSDGQSSISPKVEFFATIDPNNPALFKAGLEEHILDPRRIEAIIKGLGLTIGTSGQVEPLHAQNFWHELEPQPPVEDDFIPPAPGLDY